MRKTSLRSRLWRRSARIVVAALVVGVIALLFRTLSSGGVFAVVEPHLDGTCRAVAALPVTAMAADPTHRRVWLAVAGAGAADGLYVYTLDRDEPPQRLSATPAGFHPVALTLGAAPGGGLLLIAGGPMTPHSGRILQFAIDDRAPAPSLSETATIASSLFTHLSALTAAAAPSSFYAAVAPVQATDFFSLLWAHVRPGRGQLIYYDGQMPHVMDDSVRSPRGLALSADGTRLFVAAEIGRGIDSYDIAPFTGRLTSASHYDLPLAPAQLSMGSNALVVAGDPKLFARQIYRHDPSRPSPSEVVEVALAGDTPVAMRPLLVADGAQLGSADAAVRLGDRLVVGSALGRRLLDCKLQ